MDRAAPRRGRRPDGLLDLRRLGVLEQVADRAGVERLEDLLPVGEGRQHDHGDLGVGRSDAPRRLDPVEDGHLEVHQDDVRGRTLALLERVPAVGCRADELDAVERRRRAAPAPSGRRRGRPRSAVGSSCAAAPARTSSPRPAPSVHRACRPHSPRAPRGATAPRGPPHGGARARPARSLRRHRPPRGARGCRSSSPRRETPPARAWRSTLRTASAAAR